MAAMDARAITRVVLRNYKSIGACDVRPERLTLLVGANGSGKSNFLDALNFVAQALRFSLEHALRERGGIGDVRRRSRGHPNHFSIGLQMSLAEGKASYDVRLGARPRGEYRVQHEECRVQSTDPAKSGYFIVRDGEITDAFTGQLPPVGGSDRLYLLAASSHPVFRPVYDLLSKMAFYNLEPRRIRDLQPSAPADLLNPDGGNIASVFAALQSRDPARAERIVRYVSSIAPGTVGVETRAFGHMLTLEFRQRVRGDEHPWRFLAHNVSDGTLRAFGVLVALHQNGAGASPAGRVVGIEEPENALHPAAAETLMDVLLEASQQTQVFVTTHSADLLDQKALPVDSLLAVATEDGATRLAPVDERGREILKDGLSTPGELLRMDLLQPAPGEASTSPTGLFAPLT